MLCMDSGIWISHCGNADAEKSWEVGTVCVQSGATLASNSISGNYLPLTQLPNRTHPASDNTIASKMRYNEISPPRGGARIAWRQEKGNLGVVSDEIPLDAILPFPPC